MLFDGPKFRQRALSHQRRATESAYGKMRDLECVELRNLIVDLRKNYTRQTLSTCANQGFTLFVMYYSFLYLFISRFFSSTFTQNL